MCVYFYMCCKFSVESRANWIWKETCYGFPTSWSLLNFLLLLQEKTPALEIWREQELLIFIEIWNNIFLFSMIWSLGFFFAFNGFLSTVVFSSQLPPVYWILIEFFYCNDFFCVYLFIYLFIAWVYAKLLSFPLAGFQFRSYLSLALFFCSEESFLFFTAFFPLCSCLSLLFITLILYYTCYLL